MKSKCKQCNNDYTKNKPWQLYCCVGCKNKHNARYDREYAKEYAQTPVFKYNVHKQTAKRRGILFELSFEEWWAYWEPHWQHRGRGKGFLCMSRYGDSGSYVLGNVYINTYEENSKEASEKQDQLRDTNTGRFTSADD